MIRKMLLAGALVAAAMISVAAPAKEYEDYTREKGLWTITAMEVDPNHIDDYLTGLRKSQVPGLEILKKRGIIDAYRFVVRAGYVKGSSNVRIEVHYPNIAALAPDKARDQAIEKEIYATFSEEDGKIAVAGYEKYRQFIEEGMWSEVTFAK